ncbi:TfuA-like protein [Microvirga roseola]|uniref:TfuA-like protein n=1 Tax=Microvirga roseola TaxID=2883126 RepID=UPI001E2867F1|nr:TfuA-like protein [Microvirga roseola]
MGTVVAFLGPTLRRDNAILRLDAICCPPAEQGDIVRAVLSMQAAVIVLIDGVFAQAPAIRHKEILWALARGVHVVGAGSMGALRAAELHPFGMQGHGLVYRWYRVTPLADDDEVAVAMMPRELGSHALSEALINIRLTLRKAERAGIITQELRQSLGEIARSLHFVDRTYQVLFQRACILLPEEQRMPIEPLKDWICTNAVDQKRIDAVGLLRRIVSERDALLATRHDPTFSFRMTEAWAADLDTAGLYGPDIL